MGISEGVYKPHQRFFTGRQWYPPIFKLITDCTVSRAIIFSVYPHQSDRLVSCSHFRPFTDQAADLSSGTSRDDFRTIVRRVIDIPNAGQTRIQQALEQAIHDVRNAGPCLRADVRA